MTDYASLDNALTEAAMIVVGNDAIDNEQRAFSALRRSGFTTQFVSAMWDEIHQRASEMKDSFGYSRNVVFLNVVGSVH